MPLGDVDFRLAIHAPIFFVNGLFGAAAKIAARIVATDAATPAA